MLEFKEFKEDYRIKRTAMLCCDNLGHFIVFLNIDKKKTEWPIRVKTSNRWDSTKNPLTNSYMPGCKLFDANFQRISEAQIALWLPGVTFSLVKQNIGIDIIAVFSNQDTAFIERLEPYVK